jgi:WD40 repeat protein
MTEALAEI